MVPVIVADGLRERTAPGGTLMAAGGARLQAGLRDKQFENNLRDFYANRRGQN